MGKKRDKKAVEKKKGRMPCCEKEGVKRGAWTAEEDKILVDYITQNGHGTWRNLPKFAGLLRCGKSCRLRWTNYLRPDIKRGPFTPEEESTIIQLHSTLGNKWAAISSHLPGRTDNDIKNFWNSHLRKRFTTKSVLDQPSSSSKSVNTNLDSRNSAQWESASPALPLNLPPSKFEGDYFLRLWNSKVGESFRNSSNDCPSASSASQTSSLTKADSVSRAVITPVSEQKVVSCKKEADVYSDSSKSYDLDDSSDAMMKLLLDFPVGDNDMGFLQEDVSAYIQD